MSAKQPRKPRKSKVPEPGSIEARRLDVVAKLGATFGILDDPAELRPVGPGNGVLHYGVFVSVGLAEQILNRLDTLLAALNDATRSPNAESGEEIPQLTKPQPTKGSKR